jgi:hypothetical protein
MCLASETVTLKGGTTVSLDALQLLWSFQERGCIVRLAADDCSMLQVGPRQLITDAERERIRELKPELLTLVSYCETVQ